MPTYEKYTKEEIEKYTKQIERCICEGKTALQTTIAVFGEQYATAFHLYNFFKKYHNTTYNEYKINFVKLNKIKIKMKAHRAFLINTFGKDNNGNDIMSPDFDIENYEQGNAIPVLAIYANKKLDFLSPINNRENEKLELEYSISKLKALRNGVDLTETDKQEIDNQIQSLQSEIDSITDEEINKEKEEIFKQNIETAAFGEGNPEALKMVIAANYKEESSQGNGVLDFTPEELDLLSEEELNALSIARKAKERLLNKNNEESNEYQ